MHTQPDVLSLRSTAESHNGADVPALVHDGRVRRTKRVSMLRSSAGNSGRRLIAALTILVVAPFTLASCGSGKQDPHPSASSSVPAAFRAACGHPGSTVTVKHFPQRIHRADCDLTGVGIDAGEYGGATVPGSGGVGNSSGLTISVEHDSKGVVVVIKAQGQPGNA